MQLFTALWYIDLDRLVSWAGYMILLIVKEEDTALDMPYRVCRIHRVKSGLPAAPAAATSTEAGAAAAAAAAVAQKQLRRDQQQQQQQQQHEHQRQEEQPLLFGR
ncbi:hypothetical protein EBH_0014420 [Eimeria brunetti]|uniref:Uncharacterized protein n=1 Tax=Eimeria brunetti TaxID=51314 RepID=U6LGY6_9EIME|nr:hypothetical protein EBH_0014420 [Eimeria brunetti]